VDPVLTDLGETSGWAVLVGVLRRILAGERGEDLLAGLDPTDTSITERTLDALADLHPSSPHPEDTDE
jgi:hypothetical protein